MDSVILELRHALRRLGRRRSYSVLAVATLALGIAGVSAVSGIAKPLLVNALPYPHAEQLVRMWRPADWRGREIGVLRDQWSEFSAVASFRSADVTLERDGAPTRLVPGITASHELFAVLDVAPLLGGQFERGDDVPGAAPKAMLSYDLWRDLGGDSRIVGQLVTLDGTAHQVVGVMPRGFWFPDPSIRVWTNDTINTTSGIGLYTLIGRVAPGHRADAMQPSIDRATRILGERFTYEPQWDMTKNATLTTFRDWMIGPLEPALVATIAGVSIILLIACANVAALVLGQVEARGSELAVRAALGADRWRMVWQLVIEVLVIGAASGAMGALLAFAGFSVLRDSLPLGAWSARTSLDWWLFGIAISVAVLGASAVALIPAISVWRSDPRPLLAGARTSVFGRRANAQSAMIVGEVALATLLACGAGVLARSVQKLYSIDPGFDVDGIAVVDVAAPTGSSTTDRLGMLRAATEAVARLPEARSVGVAQMLPLRGRSYSMGLRIPAVSADIPSPFFRMVSNGYFAAMGMRVVAGRSFNGSERATDSIKSIVVNETLVKYYFPNSNPIGQTLLGGFGGLERIVGVVSDVSEGELTGPRAPARYYLADQVPFVPPEQAIVVRLASRNVDGFLTSARRAVGAAAPRLAVSQTTSMSRVFAKAVGPARDVVALLGVLTGLALLLAAVGIYGVMSQFVARRGRDWSIRIALGLTPLRVMNLIVVRTATLVIAGIAIGAVAGVATIRLVSSLLFGVAPTDPVSLSIAAVLLTATGLVASLVPALRAGRSDPARMLRDY